MNNDGYILFIDSGIGGLTILNGFLSKKHNVNIIYYADTKNYPYGKKSESKIGEILFDIYKSVSKCYKVSLIVIACNTASVSALDYLRGHIKNIPIIGTVPAVKPASILTKNNKIGIVATETTVKLDYLNKLISQFASDKNVTIKSSADLVDAVECNFNKDKTAKIIENELSIFKEKDIDVLVLGCTHYSFLKKEISDYFENKVSVIDSVDGLTKRILTLLPDDVESNNSNKLLIISNGDNKIKEKYIALNKRLKIFNVITTGDALCQKD